MQWALPAAKPTSCGERFIDDGSAGHKLFADNGIDMSHAATTKQNVSSTMHNVGPLAQNQPNRFKQTYRKRDLQ